MKRKCELRIILYLAAIVAGCRIGMVNSFAEEIYTAADGNQIDEKDLNDDVIEYREIGSLIHFNNSNVQLARANLQRTKTDYGELKNQLLWERSDSVSERKKAKDEKDVSSYMENATNEKIYSSAISAYNTVIDKLDSSSTANENWKVLEKRITNAAQNLMISYQTLTQEEETLTQLSSLYQQIEEETLAKKQAGLSTETELMEAKDQLNSTENSLYSIRSGEKEVYNKLCLLLGLETGDSYTIQQIPEFNQDLLNNIHLEEDIGTAEDNNQTIISTRHTSTNGSTAANKDKALKENGQNNVLTVKMNSLYGNIVNAESASETALSGLEAAELSYHNASVKYSSGLSGKAEYLQAQVNYAQKTAGSKTANLNLFQTYETYEWAVKGFTDLE